MTDLTRNEAETPKASTPVLKGMAVLSFLLSLSGVFFWVPTLFMPQPEQISHDLVAFIQRVANGALQQYTPQMRGFLPVLGALFTLSSLVQIPVSFGVWQGNDRALAVLRIIAYLKIALFVTSGLLLGLAVFSSVNPGNPPWTTTASGWVASLVFIAIYFWIIRVINRRLGDPTDLEALGDAEEEAAGPSPAF